MKKKLILLVMLVSLLALSLAFFSCGEDEGNASLPGTWVASGTRAEYAAEAASEGTLTAEQAEAMYIVLGIPEKFDYAKLVFTETTFTMYDINPKDGEETEDQKGTYSVDGSNVTLTSGKDSITCTVSGKRLTIKDKDTGNETVFTKR